MFFFFFLLINFHCINSSQIAYTQDQLASYLRSNVTNITVMNNMNFNPATWRENQMRIVLSENTEYYIWGDNNEDQYPILDISGLSGIKSLPTFAFPRGTIDINNNAILNLRWITFTCDTYINTIKDFKNYFGIIHFRNVTNTFVLEDCEILLGPRSNLTLFVEDLLGNNNVTLLNYTREDGDNLIIHNLFMNFNPIFSHFKNIIFTRLNYINVSNGESFANNLSNISYVTWILLLENIKIPSNLSVISINNTLYIDSLSSNILLDFNYLIGRILLGKFAVLRFIGNFQIINSVALPNLFNEEGLLPIITMSNLNESSPYFGGSVVLENTIIYGKHNNPLYFSQNQLKIPDCSAPYIPTIVTSSPKIFSLRRWQLSLSDLLYCTENIVTSNPSYKRFVNVTLKNGTYADFNVRNKDLIIILSIIIPLFFVFSICIIIFVLIKLKKNIIVETKLIEKGLLDNAQDLFGKSCNLLFYELLGCGAYGRVYKAKYYDELIALKITVPFRESLNEGLLAQSLDHPNIVRTINHAIREKKDISINSRNENIDELINIEKKKYFNNESIPDINIQSYINSKNSQTINHQLQELWIIQEYCDLGSLQKSINNERFRNHVGEAEIYNILLTLQDIAKGLEYLHSKGVIHCDLNCNNVLLRSKEHTPFDTRKFFAKLCDFGMITFFSNWSGSYKSVDAMGTITHMAPEMIQHGHQSTACDIYAFGIMMWEIFNGSIAYETVPQTSIINCVLNEKKRPSFSNNCPDRFVKLANDCWNHERNLRPEWDHINTELQNLITENRELERNTKFENQRHSFENQRLSVQINRKNSNNLSKITE